MERDRFETFIRALCASPSRRVALRVLTAAAFSGLVPLGARSVGAKGKKKGGGKKMGKGKGKKKSCPQGKRKCGNRCISDQRCCDYYDCISRCRNETECVNGSCQCSPELVMHNGVCGFLVPCLSFGEPCTSSNECCGSGCRNDGSGQLRCLGKSNYQCMTDNDCESGRCRGFLCPEALEPVLDLCGFS